MISDIEYDVSIVIPTFEANSSLIAAIRSVLNCAQLRIEIVVIDDGSKNPSLEILRTHFGQLISNRTTDNTHVIRYFDQTNSGAYLARLNAVKYCNGRYLKFLDQDDVLIEGSLLIETQAFDEKANVVLSNWYIGQQDTELNSQSKEFVRMYAPRLDDPINDFLVYGGVFTSAALYETEFLRPILIPVSGFVPIKADDWLIFAQACLAGAKYKTIQIDSYVWNQSPCQLSKRQRSRLVSEHYQILFWIEGQLEDSDRLTEKRKQLLANYYAKQLIEAFSLDRPIFEALTHRVISLYPKYRIQHGNWLYRGLCNLLGINHGVGVYVFLKSKVRAKILGAKTVRKC